MRGAKEERKKLHEHEAFLFLFVVVFLFGGFIFWSHGGLALEYSIGENSVGESFEVNAPVGEEKVVELTIIKSSTESLEETEEAGVETVEETEEVEVADVIYSIDVQCDELIPSEEEVAEGLDGCEHLDVNLETNTVYPGESIAVDLIFMSNVVGEVEGVLNIVTNLGIDSLNFNVVFSDEIVEEESAEEETEGNPLLDMLLDALGMGEEEETEEEAVEVVEEEELRKITAVVLDGAVGLTQSNLDFGVLYYGEEQETEIIEIENLGEGLLTITGFEGGDAEGLIFVYDLEQSFNLYAGERFSFELTCVPSREGEFGAEGLTVKTLLGNFNIGIRCVGALEVDETLDEIPPVINIVSPSGGSVSGVVPVVVNTYDEGGISNNPATVSYYLDNILMGLITQHPFEFEFDSSRFENGIYEIFVKVQDYAGNIAYDSVSIWINNGGPAVQETSLVSGVEPGTIIYSEDVLNSGFSFEVDSGEGYQILESGDVIGDEFNLKVKYALASLNEDVSIELKGAKLTEGLDILMENNDVQKISKEFSGGEVVIIDIDGEVLKNLIKETGAETVVMPLLLKSDSFGDKETYSDVEVWYYPLDEDPFDITNRIIFLEYVSELMENGVEYTLFNIEFDAVVVTGG